MDILKTRYELRRLRKGNLFHLALNCKISYCSLGRRQCGLLFPYQGSNFCISEISGKGCQVESLQQLEGLSDQTEKGTPSLPFSLRMETELSSPRKRTLEFKVYHKDRMSGVTVLLGTIIERRKEERGKNLKDLLSKAVQQYAGYLADSSTIFLLG
jgi:hypothetical protein